MQNTLDGEKPRSRNSMSQKITEIQPVSEEGQGYTTGRGNLREEIVMKATMWKKYIRV